MSVATGPARWRAATVHGRASGEGPVPLRPLSVVELVDDPFTLLRARFRTLVLLTGAALVPIEMLGAWLQRASLAGPSPFGFLDAAGVDPVAPTASSLTGVTAALGLEALAFVTVHAVLAGLLARVGVSAALGEPLEPGEAVRATLRRWPRLVLVRLLGLLATYGLVLLAVVAIVLAGPAGVAVGGLLLLAAFPLGVAMHVLLLVTPVVVVVEGAGPLAALRRSASLVGRRFWGVTGAVVLASIVGGLVQLALAGLPSIVAAGFGSAGWGLAGAGTLAAAIVVTPYTALVAAVVYVDARVRTEALDLQVAASHIGEDRAPAGG